MKRSLENKHEETTKVSHTFFFLSIFLIYLMLRIYAWWNTVLLEDSDSIGYLNQIKIFLTFDLQRIVRMKPDSTPFYPFWGALFSLPGWSVEIGARLCSLFFSAILFLCVMKIGLQIAGPVGAAIGLLILSFNPVLIPLSFSVLTEPSYMAMIYLGLWLFWVQYENPKFWKAGLLGIIFGFSFLNRTEGILFLLFIPFLQGVHFLFTKIRCYNIKHFIGWTLLFILCFSLIAIPQIWLVSHKLGHLAINGRQVWILILNNTDGKSYEEKLYGVDFSPDQINVDYVQDHPEVQEKFVLNMRVEQYLKKIMWNFDDLLKEKIKTLIGILGLIFFSFGLLAFYQSGRFFEIFVIIAFISVNLIAPLIHVVIIRHIAVVAPLIMLIEGVGIIYLSQRLTGRYKNKSLGKWVLPLVLFLCLVAASAHAYSPILNPPQFNRDYSPNDLKEPIRIVQDIAEKKLHRSPAISARKGYLAYFTEAKRLPVPYTNYDGLVRYCSLNQIDFLFLEHRMVERFPFFEEFLQDNPPPEFPLIYRGMDSFGKKMELYRFKGQREDRDAIINGKI